MLPREAQSEVLRRVRPGPVEMRALEAAGGWVLASPILAGRNVPAFPQSAMDGYALAAGGPLTAGSRYRLVGMSRAGGEAPPRVGPGEAVRIFTGAPVPEGAGCVAKQEIVTAGPEWVELDEAVSEGLHVRPAGSDVPHGSQALAAGTRLQPPALALLRALGVEFVPVHRAPRVALVASGDELCEDPGALRPGMVLECTSSALREALRAEGLTLQSFRIARDTMPAHLQALRAALAECEVLVVTGGVSVGDFDLVRPALSEMGIETVFWRVQQKPGGPMFFGARDDQVVFGLPGNPASTLVCWYQYVLPAVRRMLGWRNPRLVRVPAVLRHEYRKAAGKQHFARARLVESDGTLGVVPDPQQDSHTLCPFAAAHALAVFEADRTRYDAGETVGCDLLPGLTPDRGGEDGGW